MESWEELRERILKGIEEINAAPVVHRWRKFEALTRISQCLTVEARDKPAITSLRLLAVLTVLSSTPPLVKRRAPRTDGPLTHFASPRGEKSGLKAEHFPIQWNH